MYHAHQTYTRARTLPPDHFSHKYNTINDLRTIILIQVLKPTNATLYLPQSSKHDSAQTYLILMVSGHNMPSLLAVPASEVPGYLLIVLLT